jgi:hypothetical protein
MTSPTTAPSTSTPASMFIPYFAPDEPDDNTIKSGNQLVRPADLRTPPATRQQLDHRRQVELDQLVHAPGRTAKYASSNKSKITTRPRPAPTDGPNAGCGITSVLRMTNVRTSAGATTVKNKLDQMVATGNTNVAMGMVWGWHMISPNAPFADGVGLRHQERQQGHRPAHRRRQRHGRDQQPQRLHLQRLRLHLAKAPEERLERGPRRRQPPATNAATPWTAARPRPAPTPPSDKGVIIYAIGVGVSTHSKTVLQGCASTPTNTTTSPTPPSWRRCSTPSPARSRTCASRSREKASPPGEGLGQADGEGSGARLRPSRPPPPPRPA